MKKMMREDDCRHDFFEIHVQHVRIRTYNIPGTYVVLVCTLCTEENPKQKIREKKRYYHDDQLRTQNSEHHQTHSS